MLLQSATPSTNWNFAPSIIVMLLSQAVLFGFLIYIARRDGHWRQEVKGWHIIWFSLGLITLFIALVSPLDALSNDALFSAHMTQHILLALIAPACLLIGTPRYWIHYLYDLPVLKKILPTLTHPIVTLVLFNFVLWLWHLPSLYEGALRDTNIHIFEHLMFLAAGVLFWSPVLHDVPPQRALGYLAKIGYLFFTMVSSSILGAIFTFAQSAIYTFYGTAPLAFGLTPLDDQQLAGAIMWVPGGGLLLATILIFFALWLQSEDRKGQAKYPPPPYVQ
jgi:cytochrome c oxidase assembly factor CtaG